MPEYPFPAAIDDLELTYKNLLQVYKSESIGFYGASQGAYYTFQLCYRLIFNELSVPAAIAAWGGGGEIAEGGHTAETDSKITNNDLDPLVRNTGSTNFLTSRGKIDVKDPLVSPIYADLSKFPPALLASGSRDHALSSTIMMHTALKKAGIEAELFVFEGMHHLFSAMHDLPEAQDLHKFTALFFKKYLRI